MFNQKTNVCTTQKLGVRKRVLLSVASWLTTGAIATSPAVAATFAVSESAFEFANFSHRPYASDVLTYSNTLTMAQFNSSANAIGETDAVFASLPSGAPFAGSLSSSVALGEGESYFGLAQSEARILGNFFMEEPEYFSFDFAGIVNLQAFSNNPQYEKASSSGDLSFWIFDSSDLNNIRLLDFLSLSTGLHTGTNNDFISYDNSDSVTANYFSQTSFGGSQESAGVSFYGSFQRYFDSPTHLTLIEVNANRASVKTPEPALTLGLLFFGIGMGLKSQTKLSKKRDGLPN